MDVPKFFTAVISCTGSGLQPLVGGLRCYHKRLHNTYIHTYIYVCLCTFITYVTLIGVRLTLHRIPVQPTTQRYCSSFAASFPSSSFSTSLNSNTVNSDLPVRITFTLKMAVAMYAESCIFLSKHATVEKS